MSPTKTLKNLLGLAVLGFGVLQASTVLAAAPTASASASATAHIITPLAIANGTALGFGDIIAGASGAANDGTVVITPAGARSATGGVTLGNTTGVSASAFNVTGEGSYTYTIALPSSVTLNGAGTTMTVDTFTSNPSGTGTLSGGAQTLNVGATLHVAGAQAAGNYTGTYNVTVAYQ